MTGNVHCTHFLTSGLGIKTKGDISTDNDCNISNDCNVTKYVHCRNVYWNSANPDNDRLYPDGSTDIWGQLNELKNDISSKYDLLDKKIKAVKDSIPSTSGFITEDTFNKHYHKLTQSVVTDVDFANRGVTYVPLISTGTPE